jgi:hypothetical protein
LEHYWSMLQPTLTFQTHLSALLDIIYILFKNNCVDISIAGCRTRPGKNHRIAR